MQELVGWDGWLYMSSTPNWWLQAKGIWWLDYVDVDPVFEQTLFHNIKSPSPPTGSLIQILLSPSPQNGPKNTFISGVKQPGNPCISGHLIGVPISPYLGVPSFTRWQGISPLTSQAPSWDDLSSLTEFQWNLALRDGDVQFHHWYQQMSGDQAFGDWIIFGWFLRGRPEKRGVKHLHWDKSVLPVLTWYHFFVLFSYLFGCVLVRMPHKKRVLKCVYVFILLLFYPTVASEMIGVHVCFCYLPKYSHCIL